MTFINTRAKALGLKRVDARKPLEIEVSPSDVRTGATKTPENCALARACKRAYNVDAAYFFKTSAWLEHDGYLVRYQLPADVRREIFAFDRARAMVPGVYRLARPVGVATLAANRERNKERAPRTQTAKARAAAIKNPHRRPRQVRAHMDVRGYHLDAAAHG